MMVPRGYWGKESIHPHFTTAAYKEGPQAKADQERLDTLKQRFGKVWQGITKAFKKSRNIKK